MHRLTAAEQKSIAQNYAFLQKQAGDQPVTPQIAADALAALCPYVDAQTLGQTCSRLQAGWDKMTQAYAACTAQGQPVGIEQVLDHLTQGMEEPQRKGLYLQCCEWVRQADAADGVEGAADAPQPHMLAGLPEQALRQRAAEQMENLAESMLAEVTLDDQSQPLLLGAAIYAAGIQGALPAYFTSSPELLGACLAAQQTVQSALDGQTEPERARDLAAGVLAVLVGAAVALAVGVLVVPALSPAAAALDTAIAGATELLGPGIVGALATQGGGFFLLRSLLGAAASMGTVALALSPLLAGLLAGGAVYNGLKKARAFYAAHGTKLPKTAENRQADPHPERRNREQDQANA